MDYTIWNQQIAIAKILIEPKKLYRPNKNSPQRESLQDIKIRISD